MDATYKTTRYDVPLFFVCVRTNVGYQTVAEFVVQRESEERILEAINILKEWDPSWNPPLLMCDYSEAETSAFERVFPSVSVFLCDFHREQAWTRWVRDRKHGLTDELRDCAWTSAPEDDNQPVNINYRKAETKLQASRVFKKHQKVV